MPFPIFRFENYRLKYHTSNCAKKIDKERNTKLNKQRGSDFESFRFSCNSVIGRIRQS